MSSIPPGGSIPPSVRLRGRGTRTNEWSMGPRTWDGKVSVFKKLAREMRSLPIISIFPLRPIADVFNESDSYRIIMTLPSHKSLNDVRWEIINGALFVESLINGFDFSETFPLPKDILSSGPRVNFKGGVLDIFFEKGEQP